MKRQGRLILLLWLAWLAAPLCAQTPLPVYVLADDGPFRDSFIQALDAATMPPITRVADPQQAELLIAVGDQAFQRARKLDKPLLGVYVSRSAVALAQRKRCQCQGIWAGVALNDQLAMLETMMPLARRVGVIVGPQSAWTSGMVQDYQGRLGLTLLPVSSVEELGDRLRERLAEFDALLLPVDGQLFGPGTAKLVLLTSYRLRRPVFGPDQAYVQAGSVASLYASGADLVAETLVHLQFFHNSKRLRRSGFVHTPTVAVNEHVANSFDMVFHDIYSLRDALEVSP
ncbi:MULTISPECIES: hypothetical protein [Alcanivorax]|uniref:hypothetical protein n=1 Tax=Alcanivorax TaxID=59753 RepID=UPI0025C01DF1|nr:MULTISPECIES: hypothetical protein [Alcanivorax]